MILKTSSHKKVRKNTNRISFNATCQYLNMITETNTGVQIFAALFSNHHVVILSELHDDKNLADVYEAAFRDAAAVGTLDFGIEVVPALQAQIDDDLAAFSDLGKLSSEALDELIKEMKEKGDSFGCRLALAAKYGIRLHCVDVAPRASLDVYSYLHPKAIAFKNSYPESGPDDFTESLTVEELKQVSLRAGNPDITPQEAISVFLSMVNRQRRLEYIDNRVLSGDKLILNEMISKAEGRPFGMLCGRAHGGMIDERTQGYGEVDLDGAARLVFGEAAVARVDLSQDNSSYAPSGRPIYPAEYALQGNVILPRTLEAPDAPFPGQQERLELLALHGISNQVMGPLRNDPARRRVPTVLEIKA